MGARSASLQAHGDDFAWSLADATPDATLIVAASGEIVYVNDHAGELFGYPLDELLGRPVEDLLPESLAQVHRAHRTRYQAHPTVRAMGAGLDLWARRSDGSELPVEISLSSLRLGDAEFTVAAVRDVTDRVETDAQLHRVLRTLDASNDAIFIFDATTMMYSFVNDGATRLTGYDRGQLLTMTPLHLDPHTTDAELRRLVGSLIAEEETSFVLQATMMRKDGSEVSVETTYQSARARRDRNTWVITLARDITARLAHEDELDLSSRALSDAETLVALVQDRERIARDLHDTVIQRLFGEGLSLQSTLPLLGPPAAARIQSTIDGLDEIIKELRMAVFYLQGAVSAPGGLRGRLLAAVSDSSATLGFEPRLQFDGPIETMDPHTFEEMMPVLREALSNIARHASASAVRVSVDVAGDIVLIVCDDGVGVPDEVIGGRGVGNMVDRARRLGGDASVANQPSGGTVLTWRVPAVPLIDVAALLSDVVPADVV
ncbi:MAG: histidine kinase [Ilumatobacteraceae bacterium]|nr:histidine kinase [Ilumatobacteraceae bacterium]